MYDIDLFENSASVVSTLHAAGRKAVCYVSVGTYEPYRPDAAKFPAAVKGKALDGWPDEVWLDIRRWDVLGPIFEARFDLCKSKGFDAVEPDNVDAYTNESGFPLTYNDQLTFNRRIADIAHARGLAVALKNDLDQVADLVGNFDFALNEQCFRFRECAVLSTFVNAGKAVFNVEYERKPEQFCSQANSMNFNSLYKNVELDAFRVACREAGTTPTVTPVILSVLNAASYRGGSVSPGEIVSVFGTDLGPTEALGMRLADNLVATQLDDVRLTFDGIAAPLIYAASGQVSAIVPYGIAGKSTTSVQLERGGSRSAAVTMNVVASWPGLFTASAMGNGQAAMLNQDFTVNGPARRAAHNSIVTLFGTGEGMVAPAARDGQISGVPLASPIQPVTVKIDGIQAEVLYAGAAPSLVAGVLQINVRVPAQASAGVAVPIEVAIGGRTSQNDVVMAIGEN